MQKQLGMLWIPIYFYVLSLYFKGIRTQTVILYTDPDFKGNEESVSVAKCSNLSSVMAHHLGSIWAMRNCVCIYDVLNCNGMCMEILPGSPSQNTLRAWGFSDKAVSIGPCTTDTLVDNQVVVFYGKNFTGIQETLTFNSSGCIDLPREWYRELQSVKVSNDTCVKLFDTLACAGNASYEITHSAQELPAEFIVATRSLGFCSKIESSKIFWIIVITVPCVLILLMVICLLIWKQKSFWDFLTSRSLFSGMPQWNRM